MSYLVEVVNLFEELKTLIRDSKWISEIICFLERRMLEEAENQRVIAVFSNLLSAVQNGNQAQLAIN
jgi:hypothetical protein